MFPAGLAWQTEPYNDLSTKNCKADTKIDSYCQKQNPVFIKKTTTKLIYELTNLNLYSILNQIKSQETFNNLSPSLCNTCLNHIDSKVLKLNPNWWISLNDQPGTKLI